MITIVPKSGVWRAYHAVVEKYLAANKIDPTKVTDAIDKSGGDFWKVNVDHPDWVAAQPAPLPPPVPTPRPSQEVMKRVMAIDIDDPRMTERRAICKDCDQNRGLKDDSVACGCRTCQAKSLRTWACPKGEFDALVQVSTQTHGRIIKPDRVVVLSLDSRPDRWEALKNSAKKSKFLSRWSIERYRARLPQEMIVPDWWKWDASHWATRVDHLTIIEQSYVAGHEYILILEDDAIIQDCFDEAYMAACKALPSDWLGLWLTSDGHKRAPIPIAPGLVRSTDQVMLHAYLLNRRGMRRVWQHIIEHPKQIIDGATEDLHSIEPHFYATEQNAVRQMGSRHDGVRTEFYDRFAGPSAARKTPLAVVKTGIGPKPSSRSDCGTCGKKAKAVAASGAKSETGEGLNFI